MTKKDMERPLKDFDTAAEVKKLRKKIRLYANAIIFMTGFIAGFVIGALIL